MRFHLFISVVFIILCRGVAGQQADTVKYLSLDPDRFRIECYTDTNGILIDVRETFEFRGPRIEDAVNVPAWKIKNIADTLDKSRSVYLYCTTDFRSRRAAEELYALGYRKLYSLEGGIVAWRKAGYGVVRRLLRRSSSKGSQRN